MPDLALRPPTLDDVEPTVAAINAASRSLEGRDEVDATEVRGWWTQPAPFDLASDIVLALRDGEIVGYGDVGDPGSDGRALWLDVRGDEPETLVAELERRARGRVAAGGVVRAVAGAEDEALREVLSDRGYVVVRSSYRMRIDLGPVPQEAPCWPVGVTVRSATAGVDEPLLHDLDERSFADHWGFTPTPYREWLHWLREMGEADPSLWFVADADGEPAGVALCRPHEHGDHDQGWVSVLGVVPTHRGRGIGTALLRHAFVELARRGRHSVALGVDAENTTGALRLYERAGMRVVEQSDSWELRR